MGGIWRDAAKGERKEAHATSCHPQRLFILTALAKNLIKTEIEWISQTYQLLGDLKIWPLISDFPRMTAAAALARRLGAAVKDAGAKRGSGWFSPLMAAASKAILERIPMVDLTIEIRDARVKLISLLIPVAMHDMGDTGEPKTPGSRLAQDLQLDHLPSSCRRIIVLNKMDLTDPSQTMKWMEQFEEQSCICFGVNSHNKDSIKEFLNFIQAQIRKIRNLRAGQSNYTAAVMLVGIPNVGKSAIANSLHQIGRISASEKGKLKHAVISPSPGETKDISSFKIASHPNIYVLDTPGVLDPKDIDLDMGSKLALTGAIDDYFVGEYELAQYFLAILNLSTEYKHWEKLNAKEDGRLSLDKERLLVGSNAGKRRQKQFPTDHTQVDKDFYDFIVKDVRRALFKAICSFSGDLEIEEDMRRLIEAQVVDLHAAFRVPPDSEENGLRKVAAKLLNLYRTGRLGHYTLDPIPRNSRD
ncbi:hypothetical protein ACLOJK_028464 [Asimina triloba]